MKTSRMIASVALALPLVASLAHASITPPAKTVLDRYVQVSGGRGALAKTHATHFTGKLLAFGLTGTIESWNESPDKRASEVKIGPFTLHDWTSGGKSWRTDPSGKLIALDGKDLDDALASTWFEADRWLESDQGGGTIAAAPDVKDSLGTFAVIEVTPPAGKPRQLEFDKKSGLLIRSIAKNDQVTVVSTNSDYRAVEGWMMAFKTVQEVRGAAANTATVQIESVEFPASIPDEKFAPPAAAAESGVTWLKTVGVARVPFEYRGHHVWLHASVNGGPPADFIYDTGASVTVIDSAYAAKIGLKSTGSMQAQGAGSAGGASFATLDKLRIVTDDADGVELHNLNVGVLSVNSVLAPFFWRDCAGIVGFDVIVQFVNRIDYDGHQLFFYDPKTFTYEGKGIAIPMTLAGHTPIVNVKVDGQYAGGARVDVGSSATIDLHSPFVKKNGLIAKAGKTLTVTGGGFGGTFESKLARMKSIEIGPYKINDPLIGLSTVDKGALASEDYAGNIGNELLDRFTVTLDYERRQIWLEPGTHYAERRNFSRFGAQLAKYGDEVRAAQVLAGSPAAAAGLKLDDVITSIDGKPVAEIDAQALEDHFENDTPGTKVVLIVTRDGKSKTLTATLKDIL